jgi:hypothetical protein
VRRKILTVFLIPSLIFLAHPLRAQDVDSARRFLESTYRLYDHNGAGVEMGGPYADRFYHSSLIALLREDQKVMGDGVGVLDGDPICGCQDWDGIFDLKMKIRPINSDRVEAAVSFALLKQATTRDYRFITLTLSREGRNWRIYDVVDHSDPKAPFALRKELQKEIAAGKRRSVSSAH